jgi:hypothetical protein
MMISVLVAESAWICAPPIWPATAVGAAPAPVSDRAAVLPTGREPLCCCVCSWLWNAVCCCWGDEA